MMKPLMILIFIACHLQSCSQKQTYISDVDALYRILKNKPSFKKQITGEHKKAYDTLSGHEDGYFAR